jgi:serine/threonine protein kinase
MVELRQAKISDYTLQKKIGNGAFGKVYLATDNQSKEQVAIKQLSKAVLIKSNKQEAVMSEKAILRRFIGHPFLIQLKATCVDSENLYFVFEHCKNGTLANLV